MVHKYERYLKTEQFKINKNALLAYFNESKSVCHCVLILFLLLQKNDLTCATVCIISTKTLNHKEPEETH